MLELYHADQSVCAQKVRMVLAEKKLDWTGHLLNLWADEQYQPSYLALNPNGVVPTIVHDDNVVIESTVICEYLDDCFSGPPLRPSDPYGRARMRVWTQMEDSVHFAAGVVTLGVAFRQYDLKRSPDELESRVNRIADRARRELHRDAIQKGVDSPFFADAMRRFDRLLTDMENTLQDQAWLAGEDRSLADIAYIPYVTRLLDLQFHPMLDQRPNVQAWFDRIKTWPSYEEAFVKWHNPAKLDLMKQTGAEHWPKARRHLA